MALHRSTGRTRAAFPYFVVVQSNAFRELKRRLAIPLLRRDAMPAAVSTLLHLSSFPVGAFGERVTSLADDGDSIIAAIDFAVARGFA